MVSLSLRLTNSLKGSQAFTQAHQGRVGSVNRGQFKPSNGALSPKLRGPVQTTLFFRAYFEKVYVNVKSYIDLAIAETNAGYSNRLNR